MRGGVDENPFRNVLMPSLRAFSVRPMSDVMYHYGV